MSIETEFINEDWRVIKKGSHGDIFEKKDGSIIITGTWNGIGMSYSVHYPPTYSKEQMMEIMTSCVSSTWGRTFSETQEAYDTFLKERGLWGSTKNKI